jgi:hypothetical protein
VCVCVCVCSSHQSIGLHLGIQNVRTARAAGINSIMPYVFPNPRTIINGGTNATNQLKTAVVCSVAGGNPLNQVLWIDIETDNFNPWSSNKQINADIIFELWAEQWQFSDVAGTYTSAYMWSLITGQSELLENEHGLAANGKPHPFMERLRKTAMSIPRKGVPDTPLHKQIVKRSIPIANGKSIALWYADWDGQPNFNSFRPFGPFHSPFAKQYMNDQNRCGINTDLNWSPI